MIIERADAFDAIAISHFLRPEDVEELRVASGRDDTAATVMDCVERSDVAYIAYDGNDPVMIGGITAKDRPFGIVWGVATPRIIKNFREIATLTKPVLRDWFLMFPEMKLMFNHSMTVNTVHHRWLRWAGAELFPPVPRGPNGELFTPFLIRRSTYV